MNKVNRFGGPWTRLKLDTLEGYLRFYTTALKNKGFRLHYIDAFAGSGICEIRKGDEVERLVGSAQRAINVSPPFDRFDFIESDRRRVKALREIKAKYPDRNIHIHEADANDKLKEICTGRDWRSTRAVLFIDPYGMSMNYDTLKAVADTQAIDVWYLFPLSALVRQAAKDRRAVTPDKESALTRLLGDDSWHDIWYSKNPTVDMFNDDRYQRDVDVDAIEEFVLHRLAQIFPKVAQPRRLYLNGNVSLFSLIFAVSNPAPKAIELSMRAANRLLQARN
jgi:three-Cys-motif partner protein